MIEALTVGISGLGTAMVALLWGRLQAADTRLKLRHHRAGNASVADLLVYAAVVDDGVIIGKNGSLMAAWSYQGDDIASCSDEQRNANAARLNQALARLGNGWMIHIDAVRVPCAAYPTANRSHFPDPVSAAIDEERRRLFQRLDTMYEGQFVLTLTYMPPVTAQSRIVEMMFDDDNYSPDSTARTRALLSYFQRECASLESRLSSVLTLERLCSWKTGTEDGKEITYDDQLAWLQYCICGMRQPMRLPNNPMYLDAVLGGQEMVTGVIPKIGRHFIQTVAIEGFPLEATPGMLTALGEMPIEYRWSSRFIFMDTFEAARHLDKFRKKWRQKIRGFFDQVFNTGTGVIDQDAVEMVGDAEAAIAEVNSGLAAEGYYTSLVILMHEDRDQVIAFARQVEKAINGLGFAARVETINTLDAYFGSLPGHSAENVRRPLLNSLNLACLIPTSTIWTGSDHAPCPHYPPEAPALMQCVTQGATPVRVNLHVRDLGHTLIAGPTRSGKSTKLALIATQLRRYAGMTIFAFDFGMSIFPITKSVGGKHFIIGDEDDRLAFCPLQFLATRGDRAWAMEWIETILTLNNMTVTPAQRNEIASAILSMHASGARTLSEFSVTVQDEAIRAALRQYTVDGTMGALLDAEEDGLDLSSFTAFEMEKLMSLGEKFALPTLLYLFRRIETSLRGQPAAILLDEVWVMLGHPAFRPRLRVWLKTLAKANCLVLMATQNISDAANSGILDVIIESTATKIFLPNLYARDPDTAQLYQRMGLNPRQIEVIASAIPKQQYYLVSERGSRLYDLALGPLALAFVGATDKDSIAAIQQLEAKHGRKWIEKWLAGRHLRLADYGVSL